QLATRVARALRALPDMREMVGVEDIVMRDITAAAQHQAHRPCEAQAGETVDDEVEIGRAAGRDNDLPRIAQRLRPAGEHGDADGIEEALDGFDIGRGRARHRALEPLDAAKLQRAGALYRAGDGQRLRRRADARTATAGADLDQHAEPSFVEALSGPSL